MNNTPSEKDFAYTYIDTQSGLNDVVKRFKKADRIAIDTEADSLHNYLPKVCLIQACCDDEQFIIDPLADIDIKPLLQVLREKPLIFHGGDYDLRMLKDSYGLEIKADIFDTMLAGKILGFERLGLAALVEKFCGIKLSKEGQKSDWSKRPITEKLLIYASNDTRFLFEITDRLEALLKESGRADWHRELCAHLKETAYTEKEAEVEEWRIKGATLFDSSKLRVLKSLWYWREKEAEKINQPVFKIMHNKAMLSLSKNYPITTKNEAASKSFLKKYTKKKSFIDGLHEAISAGLSEAPENWPEKMKRKRRKPVQDSTKYVGQLRDACREYANAENIPVSIFASRQILERVIRENPATEKDLIEKCEMMKWQAELMLPIVKNVFKDGIN